MRLPEIRERHLLSLAAFPALERAPRLLSLPPQRSVQIGGVFRRIEVLADDHA